MRASHSSLTRFQRLGAACLRGLWFLLIPALLTAVVWRYAPLSLGTPGAQSEPWQRLVWEYRSAFWILTFLLFVAILRYWRAHLPGARYLDEAATSSGQGNDDAEPQRGRSLLRTLTLVFGVLLAGGAALLLRQHVLQLYRVSSSSMLPSLEPGDQVAISRLAYGVTPAQRRLPARGDVVVFTRVQVGAADELIKRVIGLAGDRIEMHGGHPLINGWEVPSCDAGRYVYFVPGEKVDGRLLVEFLGDQAYLTVHVPPAQPFEAYTVPANQLFLLGDNRHRSRDSRVWNDGKAAGLPLANLEGRLELIVASPRRQAGTDFLRPPNLELNLHPLDTRELETGVARCLATRPKQTRPPLPSAPESKAPTASASAP